ncbi:MAG: hypothetical protein IJU29_08435 [Oscillospiraceae bacterium]|nr:hypothetical protein [Oscillospiraceae bacterium]
MARKYADEINLSEEDQKKINQYSEMYRQAEAEGNTAGMNAAHEAAEKVRAGYGYSGGQYGDDYIGLEQPKAETLQQSVRQVRAETPGYVTEQRNLVNSAQDALQNQGSFRYDRQQPEFYDQFSGQLQDVANQMANYQPFSYDAERPGPYQTQYDAQIGRAAEALENYGPFEMSREAPQFQDTYGGARNEMLDRLVNEQQFSYDPNTDPTYQAYRQQYLREGARGRADALGQAAALTGGTLSTAALAASQQAGDYYNSQLNDALPQLQQQAYNQYLDRLMNNRQNLSSAMAMSDQERSWYENDMNRWNTDRNFEYGAYRDRRNDLAGNVDMYRGLENDAYGRYQDRQDLYDRDRNFAYNAWQDQYNMAGDTFDRLSGRSDAAWNRYQDQLGQYNADRNFALNAYNNETNRLRGNVDSARNVLGDYYGMNESDRSFAYNTGRAAVSDQQWADEMAYQQQRDAVGDAQWEREMRYKENGGAVGARRSAGGGGDTGNGTGGGSSGGSGSQTGSGSATGTAAGGWIDSVSKSSGKTEPSQGSADSAEKERRKRSSGGNSYSGGGSRNSQELY